MCCVCVCSRDSNRGLFKHFFGEDGKKRMQLAHFDEFLRGLHDEIVRLEFTHYDFKNQVRLLSSFPTTVSKKLSACCSVYIGFLYTGCMNNGK